MLHKSRMNILILGSGGREHALAWKMAASPLSEKLYCAPGNAGIAREAECVALDLADHKAVIAFCKTSKIDLVVVGPEVPLCAGIVDDLEAAGIKSVRAEQMGGAAGRLRKASPRTCARPTRFRPPLTSASRARARPRTTCARRARRSW